MNTIFAKNIWKENRAFTKKDLIHENFECDIFINENKLTDNMIIKKENNITYVFKKDYIDINKMFKKCSSLTSINLSNFNTSNVTHMASMFESCSSLTSINLSNFNTHKIIDMSAMFYDCYSLTSIDLSNFNTNNVTNMHAMFCGCSLLTSINLSNFNTYNVTLMDAMFKNCKSLNFLDITSFNCQKINTTDCLEKMFFGCVSLKIANIKYNDFKIRSQIIIDLMGIP